MLAGNLSAEEEAEIRRRLAELKDELSVLEAERQVLAKVGFPLFFCDFQAENAKIAPFFREFY